ncbi:ribosome maturation factor RimP [Marivirga sp. S37H4]|uniref:Ribosome maturation factor RimP n=1 Tax=Marivirga aurantiaca TaxID=2802615 RepID=A0A934X0K5_9BACT|nr:ribosome maturation factor RimP [Marivirga aurantiaca]MBK6266723.1 ribosome maturation factor RimP [Marivirga aurantiaca]
MDLEAKINAYLQEIITDPNYFIVDIVISGSDKRKIMILLDGDEGVDIDFCASVSRQLSARLEEDEVMGEQPYILEVSSPGLDHPLANERQYKKNIGREVKVETIDDTIITGELLKVEPGFILVSQQIKEKGSKKIKEEEVSIPFQSIKKTKVLVSFK